MMTIILFILIFGVVVLSHEFGHFLIAKLNGIHVVEFSVGMGPTICSFKRKETKYALKLLPIGGACMFEGEDGLESESTPEEEKSDEGSFLKANIWARMATVVAGPIFNFILAFIVAIIVVSIQAPARGVVGDVSEGSPAQAAGLQAGDRIVSINGEKTPLFKDISLITYLNQGKTMTVVYERDGQKYETEITPVYAEDAGYYLIGIYSTVLTKAEGLEVFRSAFYEMCYSVKNTYKSLGMLVTGKLSVESVVYSMLSIVLLLSVNLGILNLLPIPALDGCRLVFLIIELFRGKPVPPEKEGIVHFVGLVFFMVLMVVVLFNDLVNIFG